MKYKLMAGGIEAGQEGREANEIKGHGLNVLQENQKAKHLWSEDLRLD